jgi:helicase MOV-10
MIKFTNSFEWFNENIQSNPEQVQAITHIVNGTSYPAPYIIFGPPGTGKTSTITETICQLWKMLPTARILVTAQSNAACNEVGERLLKYLPKKDIYRLFARSFEEKIKEVDEKLLKASNMVTRRHQYPEWSEFYSYRVIICTLCTSGM